MPKSTQALIVAADAAELLGTVAVPVTLENANAMASAGEQFINACPETIVSLDMQNVEATSVAVAVALSWLPLRVAVVRNFD